MERQDREGKKIMDYLKHSLEEVRSRLNGTKRKTESLRSLVGKNVQVKRDSKYSGGVLERRDAPLHEQGFYVNGVQITIGEVSRVHMGSYTIELYQDRGAQ